MSKVAAHTKNLYDAVIRQNTLLFLQFITTTVADSSPTVKRSEFTVFTIDWVDAEWMYIGDQ